MDKTALNHQYSNLQEYIDEKGLPDIIKTNGRFDYKEDIDLDNLWWLYRDNVKLVSYSHSQDIDIDNFYHVFPHLYTLKTFFDLDLDKIEEKVRTFNKMFNIPDDTYELNNYDKEGIKAILYDISIAKLVEFGFPYVNYITDIEVSNGDEEVDLSLLPNLKGYTHHGSIKTLDISNNKLMANITINNRLTDSSLENLIYNQSNQIKRLKKINISNVSSNLKLDYTNSMIDINDFDVEEMFGVAEEYHESHISQSYLHSHCNKCLEPLKEDIEFIKNNLPQSIVYDLNYPAFNFDFDLLDLSPQEYGNKIGYYIKQKEWNINLINKVVRFEINGRKTPHKYFNKSYNGYRIRKKVVSYFV